MLQEACASDLKKRLAEVDEVNSIEGRNGHERIQFLDVMACDSER